MAECVVNDTAIGVNSYVLAGRNPSSKYAFVRRVRFQLPLALVLAVMVPTLLRAGLSPDLLWAQTTLNSMSIASAAVILSYFSWRRLHRFPGVQMGSSALWSVSLVFAAAIAVVLLLRLDYNRSILLAAPAITMAWLMFLSWSIGRTSSIRIGIVPGGTVAGLPRSPRIEWIGLREPAGRAMAGHATADAFIADLRHDHAPQWEEFIADCTLRGVPVYHAKQVVEDLTGQVSIDHLSENNFGSVLPNLNYIAIKRLIDLGATIVLLPVIVIIFAVTWLAVRIIDGPAPIFTQTRFGHRGNPFTVHKFRTMRPSGAQCEDAVEAARTRHGDTRVTPLGRWLRTSRLDEIPQFINILRGEMSWIGPRPEARELGERYEHQFPFYRYRYAVRPGISGWAQVNQGHVVDDSDIRVKLRYDFYYVKHISPWLDLLITIKTIRTMLSGFGAK